MLFVGFALQAVGYLLLLGGGPCDDRWHQAGACRRTRRNRCRRIRTCDRSHCSRPSQTPCTARRCDERRAQRHHPRGKLCAAGRIPRLVIRWRTGHRAIPVGRQLCGSHAGSQAVRVAARSHSVPTPDHARAPCDGCDPPNRSRRPTAQTRWMTSRAERFPGLRVSPQLALRVLVARPSTPDRGRGRLSREASRHRARSATPRLLAVPQQSAEPVHSAQPLIACVVASRGTARHSFRHQSAR